VNHRIIAFECIMYVIFIIVKKAWQINSGKNENIRLVLELDPRGHIDHSLPRSYTSQTHVLSYL
jgi:hypothetical protein